MIEVVWSNDEELILVRPEIAAKTRI